MATLQWTPRRSKNNPYPRAQQPLARWKNADGDQYVLRADGSIVRKMSYALGWTVVQLRTLARKGNDIQTVHAFLMQYHYERIS